MTSQDLMTDAAGTLHRPHTGAPRIVSLVPSLTELVVELGLGAHLVGRTQWCIHPAAAVADVPTVGGTKKANMKRIRDLAPTHVVLNIDENPQAMAEELAEFVPNLIVTHPMGPRDNLGLYRLFGGIFRREREAEGLCDAFEAAWQRLADARSALVKREVLYLIWKDPWMTVSRDTYIAQTLEAVDWTHAVHDPHVRYPHLEETVFKDVLESVDLVLFSSEPYAFTEEHLDACAEAYGVPRAKLRLIDGERTSWYGPRAIAGLDYLRELASAAPSRSSDR